MIFECHARAAIAFAGTPLARVVHQDLSHEMRGDSVKLSPVAPIGARCPSQPQERFVYESGWLERVAGALVPHAACSDFAEFSVSRGHHSGRCGVISGAQPPEQVRQVASVIRHCKLSDARNYNNQQYGVEAPQNN